MIDFGIELVNDELMAEEGASSVAVSSESSYHTGSRVLNFTLITLCVLTVFGSHAFIFLYTFGSGQPYIQTPADLFRILPWVLIFLIGPLGLLIVAVSRILHGSRANEIFKVLGFALPALLIFSFSLGRVFVTGLYLGHQANVAKEARDVVLRKQKEQAQELAQDQLFGIDVSKLLIKQDATAIKGLIDPAELSTKGEMYFDDKISKDWLPFFNNPNFQIGSAGGSSGETKYHFDDMYVYVQRGQENFKYYIIVSTIVNNTKYLVDVNTTNNLFGKDYAD